MDPVTHALTGAVIAKTGFKKKYSTGILLFASVVPDLDYITRFWGTDVFLRYHRGITHSVFAMLAVSFLIGLVFGLRKNFIFYFSISLLAYGSHLLLDLTNQYGTRVFSPLDWQQYSFDLTFIIDPYIVIGLFVSVVLAWKIKAKANAIAFGTIVLLGLYMGGRYYLHEKTEDYLKANLDAYTYMLCPLPNDFLRWWFIADTKDEIVVGFTDLFTKRLCIAERYRPAGENPLIEKSKESRAIKNFLYFAKYPHAELKREGGRLIVAWKELAYSFMPGEHFTAKVVMDENGKILSSDFKF